MSDNYSEKRLNLGNFRPRKFLRELVKNWPFSLVLTLAVIGFVTLVPRESLLCIGIVAILFIVWAIIPRRIESPIHFLGMLSTIGGLVIILSLLGALVWSISKVESSTARIILLSVLTLVVLLAVFLSTILYIREKRHEKRKKEELEEES